jgi:hypothetical protein
MKTLSTYEQQAIDFLNATNTSFAAKFKKHALYFADDKQARDIYRITLKNDLHTFSFDFGQSIANEGTEPTPYDVLACITKYDPYSFEDFCADFGYDSDSRQAEKIYNSVCKEWDNVQQLFTSEQIEQLQEIQ